MSRESETPEDKVCAIVVAAGASRRMGFDKLTVPVDGRPLIAHTLLAFENCPDVAEILLVAAEERITEFEKLARKHGLKKVKRVISGGAERDVSVWNGLRSLPEQFSFAAVHDAARPLTTPDLVSRCIGAARLHGAAACAEPVTDTLQRADETFRITEGVSRDGLWRMQTPQVFRVRLLQECYTKALSEGKYLTDETSAVRYCGYDVYLVPNDDWNIKVTYPRDVPLVEYLLVNRS